MEELASRPEAYALERARLEGCKARTVADEDYDLAKRVASELVALDVAWAAALEKQKSQAVANEDYDLAKRLKCEIEVLGLGRRRECETDRRRRAEIAALEECKARAVADEDFELAKRLKVEVDALRRSSPSGAAVALLPLAAAAAAPGLGVAAQPSAVQDGAAGAFEALAAIPQLAGAPRAAEAAAGVAAAPTAVPAEVTETLAAAAPANPPARAAFAAQAAEPLADATAEEEVALVEPPSAEAAAAAASPAQVAASVTPAGLLPAEAPADEALAEAPFEEPLPERASAEAAAAAQPTEGADAEPPAEVPPVAVVAEESAAEQPVEIAAIESLPAESPPAPAVEKAASVQLPAEAPSEGASSVWLPAEDASAELPAEAAAGEPTSEACVHTLFEDGSTMAVSEREADADSGPDSGGTGDWKAGEVLGAAGERDGLKEEPRLCLDGHWVNEAGEAMADIVGLTLAWADGPLVDIRWLTDRTISCSLFDKPYRAEFDEQGRLVWDDEDVWVLSASTEGAAAPAEPLPEAASARPLPEAASADGAASPAEPLPEVTFVRPLPEVASEELLPEAPAEALAAPAEPLALATSAVQPAPSVSAAPAALAAECAGHDSGSGDDNEAADEDMPVLLPAAPCFAPLPCGVPLAAGPAAEASVSAAAPAVPALAADSACGDESSSEDVEDVPALTPATPLLGSSAAAPPRPVAASGWPAAVVPRPSALPAALPAVSSATPSVPSRPAASRSRPSPFAAVRGCSGSAAEGRGGGTASGPVAIEGYAGIAENPFLAGREPKAALRIGKKVKITGQGPFQGRFGTVVGFDEDGDVELRLDDGDTKVFYRCDVSVLNEVRRAPRSPEPRPGMVSVEGDVDELYEEDAAGDAGSGTELARDTGASASSAAARELRWQRAATRVAEGPAISRPAPSAVAAAAASSATLGARRAAAATGGVPFSGGGMSVANSFVAAHDMGAQEDNVDPCAFSVKVSLPDELRLAKLKLAKVKGMGLAEASGALSVAAIQLALGDLTQVSEMARRASTAVQEAGGGEGCLRQARATRILAAVHIAADELDDALRLCQDRLDACVRAGDGVAEAVVRLALADVQLALERPREALKEAAAAVDAAKGAKDQRTAVTALQVLASAGLRVGTSGAARKAAQAGEEALAVARALGDAKEEAELLLLMARVRLARQEPEEAYAHCEQALAAAQRSGCRRAEAAAQRETAAVLLAACAELDAALEAVDEAVKLASEIGDRPGEVVARHIAANLYIQDDRLLDAVGVAEAALSMARDLKDRHLINDSLDVLVQLRAGDGQTERALEVAQEELDLVSGDDADPYRQLAALQRMVSLQLTVGDVEAAKASAEKALDINVGEARKVEGLAMQLMAEVHLSCKRYEQALSMASKAQHLFQGLGDIRAVGNVLQLAFDIYAEMGNESEALRSRQTLRLVYEAAGWRDEEATVLLGLAEMLLQVRGPREALKHAKDAVAIFQDIGDKSGEASGILVVAQCQVSSKASTDALRSTVTAQRLFQSLFDAAGEAQCLLTAAEVYIKNGASDEAARVTKQAQKICQKAGETKAEADCLQMLATVRIGVLRQAEDSGRKPKPADIEQAVNAVSDLAAMLDSVQDTEERRITCLSQLSSLRVLAEDYDGALQAANEALKKAMALERPLPLGQAMLSLAEAHHGMGNSKDAIQAAEDAVSLFEQIGDHALVATAKQAVEQAKRPPPERSSRNETFSSSSAPPSPAPTDSLKRPKAGPPSTKFVNREMPHVHGQPLGGASSLAPAGPRRGFSSVAGLDLDYGRSAVGPPTALRPPSPPRRHEPNQEKRRQQLLAAMEAKAVPKLFEVEPPRTSHLRSVLKQVRPDWTSSELSVVQEKLAAIQIDTAEELFAKLSTLGSRGINQRLKDSGKRPLKTETLEALREFGDRERSKALREMDPR